MSNKSAIHKGGCQCGAVRYEVHGALRDVVNCHCRMCQRLHGAVAPYSKAAKGDLVITEERGLTWYASSSRARRGFCGTCGASLFWDPADQPGTGIIAGTLDEPSMLKTIGHIFVAQKCTFTEIAGSAPLFDGSSHGVLDGDEL